MDYSAFFNKIANRRVPTLLRQLFDNLGLDDQYVLMAGGLPNPGVFPIKSGSFSLSDGSTIQMDESDIKVALQYGRTAGDPRLREFCTKLIRRLHDPPLMSDNKHPGTPMIVCTAGSQDAIYKTFENIVDEGDTILTDEPVYASVMSVLSPLGCKIYGVHTDRDGIILDHLREILSKWNQPKDGKPACDSNGGKLKALYVIPNGGNPSGARYTLERKKEIYKLAQEYNFLIVEDEAYFFLEKKPYSKSFLSLDVDGRVLRLDTFSKTVGPGFRIGTVTGPTKIVDKILASSMASSQGCSMIAQTVLLKLLDKWGLDGYIEHCEKVAAFYDERRKLCMELVEKHLSGLVEYDVPTGGMFLWIKCKPLEDTMELCMNNLVKRKVLMVAGSAFMVDEKPSPYMRVSFTMAPKEQLDRGLRILAEEIRSISSTDKQTNGI